MEYVTEYVMHSVIVYQALNIILKFVKGFFPTCSKNTFNEFFLCTRALSNRMFVDVILLNVFFDIILQDELEIFC